MPTDEELLRRAVLNARVSHSDGWKHRWEAVMDAFGLGSTYSRELCKRLNVNPDERVKRGRSNTHT